MSTNITHATRLTVLKHLAAGKSLEVVGAIMKLSRFEIIDIASEHGYPDVAKMAQAVADITRNIESAERDELAHRPHASTETVTARPAPRPSAVPTPPRTPRPAPPAATPRPASAPAPAAPAASNGGQEGPQVLTQPDELRAVINAGKQSSSKRVQALTNRILDELARLKEAIQAEQAKAEAARRKAAQKAAAARARAAEREALQKKKAELESELAAVKAKLRGGKPTAAKPSTAPSPETAPAAGAEETPAKEIRAWAREVGLDVPDAGRVPQKVREAYAEAHASEQAA